MGKNTHKEFVAQGEYNLGAYVISHFSLSLHFWIPKNAYFLIRASLYMETHTRTHVYIYVCV